MFDQSPLYTATYSLNARYTARFNGKVTHPFSVPGDETHAVLYRGNMQFRAHMAYFYPRGKEPKLAGQNTLTAAVTLLHTDAPPSEGKIGNVDITTIHYCLPELNDYIISTQDTFEAGDYIQPGIPQKFAKRNATFNDHVQKHIDLSGADQFNLPVTPIFDINQHAADSQFQKNFHHTEQSYMNSMYDIENMHWLKPYVRRGRIATVFGMINELNSLLPVCVNCNIGLIGFQNTAQNGYLAEFMQYVNEDEKRVVRFPDNGLTMHTRVSCMYDPDAKKNSAIHVPLTRSRTAPPKGTATQNPLTLSYDSRNKIVQCYANTSDIHRLADRYGTQDTYRGDYFTSTKMLHTKKFENYKFNQRNP